MKLFNKIKNYIKESEEACRINYEIENSVDCPYCLRHYFVEEIEKFEKNTDIKNIDVIKCLRCDNIFGVRSHVGYDPALLNWKTTVKIWENKEV